MTNHDSNDRKYVSNVTHSSWPEYVPKNLLIPSDAVLADISQQPPYNSYNGRPLYYVDIPFNCLDCGAEHVWTAGQQKWYHEVVKGSLYARAIRCLDCRRQRKTLYANGDPYPVKHAGTLLKRIFVNVDPILRTIGYQLDKKTLSSLAPSLEYSRPGAVLVIGYARPEGIPVLSAECLDTDSDCHEIFRRILTPKSDPLFEVEAVTLAIQQFFNHRIEDISDRPRQDV